MLTTLVRTPVQHASRILNDEHIEALRSPAEVRQQPSKASPYQMHDNHTRYTSRPRQKNVYNAICQEGLYDTQCWLSLVSFGKGLIRFLRYELYRRTAKATNAMTSRFAISLPEQYVEPPPKGLKQGLRLRSLFSSQRSALKLLVWGPMTVSPRWGCPCGIITLPSVCTVSRILFPTNARASKLRADELTLVTRRVS